MSVDIERLKAAMADPILDWEAGFTPAMVRAGWSSSARRAIATILNEAWHRQAPVKTVQADGKRSLGDRRRTQKGNEMTKKQLRQRLEDLYCGASGGYRFSPDDEISIMVALGPDHFGSFLRAIANTFDLKSPGEHRTPYAVRIHNLDQYTDFDNLTNFIWEQLS